MDVHLLISIFPLDAGPKLTFNTIVLAKNSFKVHVSDGILGFLDVSWTKNLNLLEPLVMRTRAWKFHFVISK